MPAWILAALPILVVLGSMIGLGWPAARAGVAGLAVTLLVALILFGYGTRVLPELGVGVATGGALLEAGFTAATILWIILPALCIHELQRRSGAIDVLRRGMGRLSRDPRIVALLVAWFFVLFVEGAAGFGTSVALAAPFLVAAGFGRVEAVTIALVGHSVGVSFGAVGTPILPQMAATGLGGRELAAATGIYHVVAGPIMPLVVMTLVARVLPHRRRPGMGVWGATLFAAACFLVPFHLLSRFVGPELPTLGGALFGGVAFVLALRIAARRTPIDVDVVADPPEPPGALVRAAAPYLVLVALVMATRLVPPLRVALASTELAWGFSVFGGEFAYAYHPGTMLFAGFFAGALWQGVSHREVAAATVRAAGQLGPVTVALVAMLSLSRIMVHAGMIDELAAASAGAAGAVWPFFAPFVGMLGTFVTGSATASNILFSDFQAATAARLGLSPATLLGAQGFGAAVGNIVCPHNVIAAGATVGLAGREGEVLRGTIGPALAYAAAGGLLALFLFT